MQLILLLPLHALNQHRHHLHSQWDQSTPHCRNPPQDPDSPDLSQELGLGIVASQAAGWCLCHLGHHAVDSAQDCEVEDSEWGSLWFQKQSNFIKLVLQLLHDWCSNDQWLYWGYTTMVAQETYVYVTTSLQNMPITFDALWGDTGTAFTIIGIRVGGVGLLVGQVVALRPGCEWHSRSCQWTWRMARCMARCSPWWDKSAIAYLTVTGPAWLWHPVWLWAIASIIQGINYSKYFYNSDLSHALSADLSHTHIDSEYPDGLGAGFH